MKLVIFLFVAMATVANTLPQNWPYRDNMEYYGYQNNNRGNFYRASNLGGGSSEDDEVEVNVGNNKARQDLKVAGGQSPSDGASPVVVVETGSAKPVTDQVNTKAATQPKSPSANPVPANPAATDANKPPQPAFPPASPPATTPTPEDSEEDSEEEEGDEEEEDDEDDDSDNRRRNDPIVNDVTNVTNTETTIKKTQQNVPNNVQTVEALVPGYVTEQGEVLVPFDTVVKEGGGVVAVVEDPNYTKNAPPVVILPSDDSDTVNEVERPVPKFFNPIGEKQLYYSEVPPPGSIFTFDDDNQVDEGVRGVARQGETSSEETLADDDTSSAQDDASESDESTSPPRPPLSFVKATAPSGEDDEAESLGIRIARMSPDYDPRFNDFYASRSPNYFYAGNGYYVTRYPSNNNRRLGYYGNNRRYQPVAERYHGYGQDYYQETGPEPIYYYRPASNEKVKVIPLASFDVSMEERESGEVRPVVSPFRYRPSASPIQHSRPQPHPLYRRRPQQPPTRPLATQNRIIIRRGDKPSNVVAVYDVQGGTPVTRQRINKQRREAKELKKNKKNVKKITVDPLGLYSHGGKKTHGGKVKRGLYEFGGMKEMKQKTTRE